MKIAERIIVTVEVFAIITVSVLAGNVLTYFVFAAAGARS